jgi:hypothetical protein
VHTIPVKTEPFRGRTNSTWRAALPARPRCRDGLPNGGRLGGVNRTSRSLRNFTKE